MERAALPSGASRFLFVYKKATTKTPQDVV